MQSLDVISFNLWQILIALLNLLVLYWLIKKFLYAPVQKMLDKRQEELNSKYDAAEKAKTQAEQDEKYWHNKIESANSEADEILKKASENANRRSDKIIDKAKAEAEDIIRQAQTDAELEHKKAKEEIKREIVDVSAALAEKMLSREINIEDHRSIIDYAIDEIGDDNGTNE